MLKNIKKYAMALVALVIAATSVTLMSFGKKEVKFTNSGWYAVADPSGGDQQILSRIGATLPPGDCQTNFNGEICAVYWEDDLSTPPSSLSALMTAYPNTVQAKHDEN